MAVGLEFGVETTGGLNVLVWFGRDSGSPAGEQHVRRFPVRVIVRDPASCSD